MGPASQVGGWADPAPWGPQAARPEFYELCALPDTFQSWFLVLQLHVWMLLVRLRHEGARGKTAQKQLVTFMWEDVENRIRLLRVRAPAAARGPPAGPALGG